MRAVVFAVILAAVAVAPAYAQEVPAAESPADTVEADPAGALVSFVESVRAGNWRGVAALVLGALMLVLGKVRDKISWFRGDRGGAILVMVLALAGTLSTALASSADLDSRLFAGAAGLAWTAVGGYTWFKRLVWPQD